MSHSTCVNSPGSSPSAHVRITRPSQASTLPSARSRACLPSGHWLIQERRGSLRMHTTQPWSTHSSSSNHRLCSRVPGTTGCSRSKSLGSWLLHSGTGILVPVTRTFTLTSQSPTRSGCERAINGGWRSTVELCTRPRSQLRRPTTPHWNATSQSASVCGSRPAPPRRESVRFGRSWAFHLRSMSTGPRGAHISRRGGATRPGSFGHGMVVRPRRPKHST